MVLQQTKTTPKRLVLLRGPYYATLYNPSLASSSRKSSYGYPFHASVTHSNSSDAGRSRSLDQPEQQQPQNPLSSVQPLDWLFADDNREPDPAPMSSPKEVRSGLDVSTSSSSGTDSETKNLLPATVTTYDDEDDNDDANVEQSRGAIPKQRTSNAGFEDNAAAANPDDDGRSWQRKAFRRRRTQEQITQSSQQGRD